MFLKIKFEDVFGEIVVEGYEVELVIDLYTKQVIDYNLSLLKTPTIWAKIRDEGIYQLIDEDEKVLAEIKDDYVPDFIPNEYGDYIDLEVEYDSGCPYVINMPASAEEIVAAFAKKVTDG
jgi:hypothetical protein